MTCFVDTLWTKNISIGDDVTAHIEPNGRLDTIAEDEVEEDLQEDPTNTMVPEVEIQNESSDEGRTHVIKDKGKGRALAPDSNEENADSESDDDEHLEEEHRSEFHARIEAQVKASELYITQLDEEERELDAQIAAWNEAQNQPLSIHNTHPDMAGTSTGSGTSPRANTDQGIRLHDGGGHGSHGDDSRGHGWGQGRGRGQGQGHVRGHGHGCGRGRGHGRGRGRGRGHSRGHGRGRGHSRHEENDTDDDNPWIDEGTGDGEYEEPTMVTGSMRCK